MAENRSPGQEMQGQILDTIRRSQEAVVDAVKAWAESVQAVTPSLPVPDVPFADQLPKPADLVASAYDFAEQLLASQRKFAEDVIKATTPVIEAAAGNKAQARQEKGGKPAA